MEQTKTISFAYACKYGLADVVIKYLAWKPDKSHEKWVEKLKKSDLIFTAIQKGYTKLVEVFINHYDIRNKDSLALHLACLYGRFEIVKLLLDHIIGWSHCDCDYSVSDFTCSKNNLAMRIAFSFGYMDIVEFLYDEAGTYGCNPDSFCMEVAWIKQDRDKLQFIIDHSNVKINEKYIVKTRIGHYYKMKFLLSASDMFFQNIMKDDFIFYSCLDKDFINIEFLLVNDMI